MGLEDSIGAWSTRATHNTSKTKFPGKGEKPVKNKDIKARLRNRLRKQGLIP